MSDSPSRANVFGNIASNWAEQNPAEAAAWLETLSAGTARDAAVERFADSVCGFDPEGAVAWAATLSNQSNRQSQVENLAREWMRQDSDAARRWITSTAVLSAEVKDKLLK